MGRLDQRFPLYSRLLKLYPPAYRQKYRGQMLQTLADMLDDEDNSAARVWTRAALDLPFSLIKQNLIYQGAIMKHDTPTYIKRSSLAGAVMLLPFFSIIVVNSLMGHRLFDSIVWSTPVIVTWLLVLPGAAALICFIAFIKWHLQLRRAEQIGLFHNLLNFRRNWPLAAVTIIGLGIIGLAVFHDSVHCVIGSPVKEVQNWDSTLHCIQER